MHEYLIDVTLNVSLRAKGRNWAEVKAQLDTLLDCADANFGAFANGAPILGEASLSHPIDFSNVAEVDGDDPCQCPDCGAIEGEPEWGTVGDGFDGYCGSCADKREADGTVEIG